MDSELHEFPLRMRDWLKNVLVTLYERDLDHNLLTEKQKLRVRIPFVSFWECSPLGSDFLPDISRAPSPKALRLHICGASKRVEGLTGQNRKPRARRFGSDAFFAVAWRQYSKSCWFRLSGEEDLREREEAAGWRPLSGSAGSRFQEELQHVHLPRPLAVRPAGPAPG